MKLKLGKIFLLLAVAAVIVLPFALASCGTPENKVEFTQEELAALSKAEIASISFKELSNGLNDAVYPSDWLDKKLNSLNKDMKYYEVIAIIGREDRIEYDFVVSGVYPPALCVWEFDDGRKLYMKFSDDEYTDDILKKVSDGYYLIPGEENYDERKKQVDERVVDELVYTPNEHIALAKRKLNRVAAAAFVKEGEEVAYLFGGAE